MADTDKRRGPTPTHANLSDLEAAAVSQAIYHLYGNGFTIDVVSWCMTCGRELAAGSMSYCREHHEAALVALATRLRADADRQYRKPPHA